MSDDTTTRATTPAATSEASESTRAVAAWLRLLRDGRYVSFADRATVEYATTALAAIERVSELEAERAEHEQRAREAEAREGRLREALLSVATRRYEEGYCWCQLAPNEHHAGVHGPICEAAREALANAPAASEPASGGGEAASDEGRGE